ncbi:MAG: ABC transporter ATP-binding protein [Candidatus Omnitrophica bacterium]|nr:ABC transporter ATP-binding protein [Candidatus Omnitrophota bacterium]
MLEVKNLSCGYGKECVLQDINFKLNDGDFVGVIGPNGSGKTTLLRGITRILKLNKGSVMLQKKDIAQMEFKDFARVIAVVPQSFNGNNLSVEEFILLGRIPHFSDMQFLESKKDLEIAHKCMKLTDTLRLKDKLMANISGGERQLALIARALTQEPKLLLLDEPTAHLDITHQVEIMDLLKKLNREFNLTVLMVLHDLNLASEYCHRLVLINEGRIYKEGPPKEILDYKVIEDVYKTVVIVQENPFSSKPYMLLVSEEERLKRGDK